MLSGETVEEGGGVVSHLSLESFHAPLPLPSGSLPPFPVHAAPPSLTNSINAESHPLHVELSDLGVRLVVYLPRLAKHPAAAHVRAPVLMQEVQDGGEHLRRARYSGEMQELRKSILQLFVRS